MKLFKIKMIDFIQIKAELPLIVHLFQGRSMDRREYNTHLHSIQTGSSVRWLGYIPLLNILRYMSMDRREYNTQYTDRVKCKMAWLYPSAKYTEIYEHG